MRKSFCRALGGGSGIVNCDTTLESIPENTSTTIPGDTGVECRRKGLAEY